MHHNTMQHNATQHNITQYKTIEATIVIIKNTTITLKQTTASHP